MPKATLLTLTGGWRLTHNRYTSQARHDGQAIRLNDRNGVIIELANLGKMNHCPCIKSVIGLLLVALSFTANGQVDLLKIRKYIFNQVDIEYTVEKVTSSKDTLKGTARLQIWDSSKIVRYENTLLFDSAYLLIMDDSAQYLDYQYHVKERPFRDESLIDTVMKAFVSRDPSYRFISSKDIRINEEVLFAGYYFDGKDRKGQMISGMMYMYEGMPKSIYVRKGYAGYPTTENMRVTRITVDNKPIPLTYEFNRFERVLLGLIELVLRP
jgi:hypothetical protein